MVEVRREPVAATGFGPCPGLATMAVRKRKTLRLTERKLIRPDQFSWLYLGASCGSALTSIM